MEAAIVDACLALLQCGFGVWTACLVVRIAYSVV